MYFAFGAKYQKAHKGDSTRGRKSPLVVLRGGGNFAVALPVAGKARRNWFGFTKQCDQQGAMRQ